MTTKKTSADKTNSTLRVIFAGTPEFAAIALSSLIKNQKNINANVIAVYTQPDRPAGRGRQLTASPVKEVAQENSIPIFQPENFKHEDSLRALSNHNADIMIVAAYGIILPLSVLSTPRLGCINIHASLLPRWRGAAPIQRAIAAGDTETGITIMQMDEGLDTGDMLLKKTCPINKEDTGSNLHDKLAELGATSLIEALELIQKENINPVPQDNNLANYAHKLNKQEAFVDWSLDAAKIEQQVRAFNSWPVAQTYFNEKVVRIWQAQAISTTNATNHAHTIGKIVAINKDSIEVQCGQGSLAITDIQLSGAKRMSVNALLNGRPDFFTIGQCFNNA